MSEAAREAEIDKYRVAYKHPPYRMGDKRVKHAGAVLLELPDGSLLDVGAGRGEGVRLAKENGHNPVIGVEPVEYLAGGPVIVGVATQLPFNDGSFDTVMCLDVLEHLIEDDIVPALNEMRRVAAKHIFLTASDKAHKNFHISMRPVEDWQAMFDKVFEGAEEIIPLGTIGVSPGWLIRI